MSSVSIKNTKPKYPETIFGTRCMAENWTICCPNKHLKYDRYSQSKEVIQIQYRGGIYRVFVCTDKCMKVIKGMSLKNPDLFKKLFIKLIKPNGDIILKHRDTHIPCQIAKKVDTYETKKQKGGRTRTRTTRRNKLNVQRKTRKHIIKY